jgi:hypothetical protein
MATGLPQVTKSRFWYSPRGKYWAFMLGLLTVGAVRTIKSRQEAPNG